MMALIMVRLMCEAGSLITALVACPITWAMNGGSKAAALLFACVVVGKMVAPTHEERAAFDKFTKRKKE